MYLGGHIQKGRDLIFSNPMSKQHTIVHQARELTMDFEVFYTKGYHMQASLMDLL